MSPVCAGPGCIGRPGPFFLSAPVQGAEQNEGAFLMHAKDRVYLASPYTHASRDVMEIRAAQAARAAALLCRKGMLAYSPIAHGRALEQAASLPPDWRFWERQCMSHLRRWATVLAVLRLDGWKESRGVAAELAEAEMLGIPVEYVDMADLERGEI